MPEYNLSIYCVDGTIYGCISHDLMQLQKFLKQYDHEGSSLSLVTRINSKFIAVDPDAIYKELGLTK